jgi:hypothetical protein
MIPALLLKSALRAGRLLLRRWQQLPDDQRRRVLAEAQALQTALLDVTRPRGEEPMKDRVSEVIGATQALRRAMGDPPDLPAS